MTIELPQSPRILIVKLWALGDILMATPLLRAMKRRFPDCHLTWVADSTHGGILAGNPLIDELIVLDTGAWRKSIRNGNVWDYYRRTRAIVDDLRRRDFHLAVNLTPEKSWSHLLAQAPVSIGMFPDPKPNRKLGRHYTVAIPRPQETYRHSTSFYLYPMTVLGDPGPYDERMILTIGDDARSEAARFLQSRPEYRHGLPVCVFHPGTSQETKCWPAESFAALHDLLSSRYNVVITGSPHEAGLAARIVSSTRSTPAPVVAAGELKNILETAALIETASLVVSGDTSALHIASALGTPVVGIYGGTRPRDNAPQFGPNTLLFDDSVPCSPCFKEHCPLAGDEHMRCMKAISPARVVDAAAMLPLSRE